MASRTPDWSSLASENERFLADGGPSAERLVAGPAGPGAPDRPAAGARAAGARAAGARAAGARAAGARAAAQPAGAWSAGAQAAAVAPRRSRWWIRGAAAGAAVALAAAGAATAAASTSAAVPPLAWHVVKQARQGPNGGFTAIAAVGLYGGWAFSGDGAAAPTAFRRSGATWTQASFPGHSDERVLAAQATSAANVWAFTTNGTRSRALRWNGRSWSVAGSFSREIAGAVVVSSTDAWVFGDQFQPGGVLGTWHYNGRTWTHVPGLGGLHGGSALSATSIWAFGGTHVSHFNGRTWSATSVAALLPPVIPGPLNDPAVMAMYAQSPTSVWAVGNGNDEDDGGPLVVLHYNGHSWSRVAQSNLSGSEVFGQVAPDGRGGLWIPVPAADGVASHLMHYSGGHLTAAVLPVAASRITVQAVAWVPGTFQALAGGVTHAPGNFGADVVSVIVHYER
jgi:hypothetical protein